MRRAFTLIELLTAILFPVFAQAKVAAKKTADLSNVKQLATVATIYSSDTDDQFPLQAGRWCDGAWNFNSRVYFPADQHHLLDERSPERVDWNDIDRANWDELNHILWESKRPGVPSPHRR